MNLNELSDDDLDQLRIQVLVEQERRQTLANAPAQADDLARRYIDAGGDPKDLPVVVIDFD